MFGAFLSLDFFSYSLIPISRRSWFLGRAGVMFLQRIFCFLLFIFQNLINNPVVNFVFGLKRQTEVVIWL